MVLLNSNKLSENFITKLNSFNWGIPCGVILYGGTPLSEWYIAGRWPRLNCWHSWSRGAEGIPMTMKTCQSSSLIALRRNCTGCKVYSYDSEHVFEQKGGWLRNMTIKHLYNVLFNSEYNILFNIEDINILIKGMNKSEGLYDYCVLRWFDSVIIYVSRYKMLIL